MDEQEFFTLYQLCITATNTLENNLALFSKAKQTYSPGFPYLVVHPGEILTHSTRGHSAAVSVPKPGEGEIQA